MNTNKLNILIKYCLNNNGNYISGIYENRNSVFVVQCQRNHVWNVSYRSLVSEKHWCRKCFSDKMKTHNPGTREDVKLKIKNTWNKKYDGHPIFNKDIYLKQARKINSPHINYHWLTNEEIICQGSWEDKVINYLNVKQIDYDWQPKAFITNLKTISGKRFSTYRPDLYLKDENKWIEIKGFFRRDALEKWNWFHKEYPNSELWDKEKLKQLGVL